MVDLSKERNKEVENVKGAGNGFNKLDFNSPNRNKQLSDTNLPQLSDMRKEEVSIGQITFDGVNGANPDHLP